MKKIQKTLTKKSDKISLLYITFVFRYALCFENYDLLMKTNREKHNCLSVCHAQ